MKKFHKLLSVLLVLCIALGFTPIQTTASSVHLNKTIVTLKVGKTCKLKVTGTDNEVVWSSSKKSVAKVNAKGKVTAKKKGKCEIIAKVDNQKYVCSVTVKPRNSGGKTVYVTETGKRYHYDNHCNGGTYYKSTLAEAKARNLTPCQKCVK